MTHEEIDTLVQQLKSITNCLYGIGADADSVYERLDKLAAYARFAATLDKDVPVCGAVSRFDPVNWALYESDRAMEDGNSFAHVHI